MSESVGARRAATDVAAQLVGRVGNLLLGLVVVVVLTRELGAAGFGQWSAIFATVQIAGYLGELGVEAAAVRLAAADREAEPGILGALVLLRAALAVPAAIVAAVVVALVADSGDMRSAGVLVALTVVVAAPAALRAVFQLRVRNDVPVLVMTVNSVLWTAAVVVLAATGSPGLAPFAAALLAVQTVTTALQAVLALRRADVDLAAARPHLRPVARIGIVAGIGQLLTLAYVRVDHVLVLHYAGDAQAGLYGAAYQVLDRAQFVPTAVVTTLFPLLAAAWPADPERLRGMLRRGIEVLALASLPVLAFSIAAAEPFMRLLFGDEFAEAADALPVLMGAFVLTCFGYLVGSMALVVGRQARFVAISAAALVLNVVANVILLPRHGYLAAAWVTLATEVLVLAIAVPTALRPVGALPVGRLPRVVAAAAAMGLAVFALRQAGAGVGWLLLAAPPAYLAAVALLRAVDVADLRALREKA